jgi:hypothetical protein
MHQSVSFTVSVVWRDQKNHLTDCYFYFTKIDGHNSKAKHNVGYPNSPSARKPVEHDDSLPIRKPPQQWTVYKEEPTSNSPEDESGPSCSNVDPDFTELTVPYLISQTELNDLARDLNLSKFQAEPLASYLWEWNFLHQLSRRKLQQ